MSQKKLDFRNLNNYDSYCLKQQFYGSKFGRNKWKSFNMTWQLLILEKEPPIILRWPKKCSQVTGKTIKGRNPKVQFFLGHPVVQSYSKYLENHEMLGFDCYSWEQLTLSAITTAFETGQGASSLVNGLSVHKPPPDW